MPQNTASVAGFVKDGDNRVLEGVAVWFEGTKYSAISNSKGFYTFAHLPDGEYLLVCSHLGYGSVRRKIELKKGQKLRNDIVLSDSTAMLDEVVVVGESEKQKLKGYAADIADTRKVAVQSILANELLDRIAGIKIRQSGGLGSDIQYTVNGLSGHSVRIFIDGIPVRNYGSSFSLSSIPPALIERIEVYKGVVPVHLSEDALGGAINVVLKKGAINNLSASYSFGSFNTHQSDAALNYRNQKSGFTANASAFYNYTDNSYKVWGDDVFVVDTDKTGKITNITAKRFHDAYRSYGINANFGFASVKWADLFALGFMISDMDKDIQNGATMRIVYGNRRTEQGTRMGNLRYEKKNILGKLDFATIAIFSHTDRLTVDTVPYQYGWFGKILKNPQGEPIKWNLNGGEAGWASLNKNGENMIANRANLAYNLNVSNRLSVNHLYNRLERKVDDPLLPAAERALLDTRYMTKNIWGGTFENKLFNQKLNSAVFVKHYSQYVRLDDYVKDRNGDIVPLTVDKTVSVSGYGLAFSFQALSRLRLLLSAEKAVRMPEDRELLGNISENIDPSYELKPEQGKNVNLGAVFGTFDLAQHRLKCDLNLFYRDISDMITRKELASATVQTYSYENLARVVSKGVDIELHYSYASRINWTLNFSTNDTRYRGAQWDGYRLRNAPYRTFNSNLEYKIDNLFLKKSKASIHYHFGYVHSFIRSWEKYGSKNSLPTIPAQKGHDLGLVYSFPGNHFTLSLDVKNIFNGQFFDNWALQKPGRAFFGKISYRIF